MVVHQKELKITDPEEFGASGSGRGRRLSKASQVIIMRNPCLDTSNTSRTSSTQGKIGTQNQPGIQSQHGTQETTQQGTGRSSKTELHIATFNCRTLSSDNAEHLLSKLKILKGFPEDLAVEWQGRLLFYRANLAGILNQSATVIKLNQELQLVTAGLDGYFAKYSDYAWHQEQYLMFVGATLESTSKESIFKTPRKPKRTRVNPLPLELFQTPKVQNVNIKNITGMQTAYPACKFNKDPITPKAKVRLTLHFEEDEIDDVTDENKTTKICDEKKLERMKMAVDQTNTIGSTGVLDGKKTGSGTTVNSRVKSAKGKTGNAGIVEKFANLGIQNGELPSERELEDNLETLKISDVKSSLAEKINRTPTKKRENGVKSNATTAATRTTARKPRRVKVDPPLIEEDILVGERLVPGWSPGTAQKDAKGKNLTSHRKQGTRRPMPTFTPLSMNGNPGLSIVTPYNPASAQPTPYYDMHNPLSPRTSQKKTHRGKVLFDTDGDEISSPSSYHSCSSTPESQSSRPSKHTKLDFADNQSDQSPAQSVKSVIKACSSVFSSSPSSMDSLPMSSARAGRTRRNVIDSESSAKDESPSSVDSLPMYGARGTGKMRAKKVQDSGMSSTTSKSHVNANAQDKNSSSVDSLPVYTARVTGRIKAKKVIDSDSSLLSICSNGAQKGQKKLDSKSQISPTATKSHDNANAQDESPSSGDSPPMYTARATSRIKAKKVFSSDSSITSVCSNAPRGRKILDSDTSLSSVSSISSQSNVKPQVAKGRRGLTSNTNSASSALSESNGKPQQITRITGRKATDSMSSRSRTSSSNSTGPLKPNSKSTTATQSNIKVSRKGTGLSSVEAISRSKISAKDSSHSFESNSRGKNITSSDSSTTSLPRGVATTLRGRKVLDSDSAVSTDSQSKLNSYHLKDKRSEKDGINTQKNISKYSIKDNQENEAPNALPSNTLPTKSSRKVLSKAAEVETFVTPAPSKCEKQPKRGKPRAQFPKNPFIL